MRRRASVHSTYLLLLAGALVLQFGWQIRTVSGNSMAPTLPDRALVVLERWPFALQEVTGAGVPAVQLARGDLISFRSPTEHRREYVKRVVGIGGDRIQVSEGRLLVNGSPDPLPAPMLEVRSLDLILEPDQVFVVGDFREVSYDSRDFGPISLTSVRGRVRAGYHLGPEAPGRPMLGVVSTP